MRVLHVLDHSLPYFSGYSFRSSYIINMQRELGLAPFVITSPKHEEFSQSCEVMNEIEYHRVNWPGFYFLPSPQKYPLLRHAACVSALAKRTAQLARELKIDLIHAHSPSLDGLAALRAASRLSIPWIYELRYYEEDSAVDRGKATFNSPRYRFARSLEQRALKRADAIVTIAASLRADLISRGIPAGKIQEVPNGVDTSVFAPRAPDPEIIARHGLAGFTVVGFIGSFYTYEGLDRLIEAMRLVLGERRDVKLALVGEGEMDELLRAQVPAELREHFVFAGRVPHKDVRQYYSVMDILVYPRLSSRLTEMTTPLKPLEAMSMERAIIGSRVGGLGELIRHKDTGLLVEAGSSNALAAAIMQLAVNAPERSGLGRRARQYVVDQRDWKRLTARYLDIYDSLIRRVQPSSVQISVQ
jgi:PEP-CTERM/exosortase A-associated glycosyltransferase